LAIAVWRRIVAFCPSPSTIIGTKMGIAISQEMSKVPGGKCTNAPPMNTTIGSLAAGRAPSAA
jgi:hypothetical protein